MKVLLPVTALIVGIIIGLWLSLLLAGRKYTPGQPPHPLATVWRWPDSLDAVVAAGRNHRVIFENEAVRILEVTLGPYEIERMHTHRFPSVMFGSPLNSRASRDIVYYRYDYDSIGRRYFIKDSSRQHMAALEPGVADSGYYMKPEQPHGLRNLSNETIDVYRVEFKDR